MCDTDMVGNVIYNFQTSDKFSIRAQEFKGISGELSIDRKYGNLTPN